MFPFFHKYPGTNLHEIDLDYVLREADEAYQQTADLKSWADEHQAEYEQLKNVVDGLVNHLVDVIVPWDSSVAYPIYSIVEYQGTNYIAVQDVPVGAMITNTEYWQPANTVIEQVNAIGQTVANNVIPLEDNAEIITELPFTPVSNRIYYIAPGTYILNETIEATASNVKICGRGAVIETSMQAPVFNITGDNVHICHFTVNNSGTHQPEDTVDHYGTIQVNGENSHIHDIEINKAVKCGILVWGATTLIEDCKIDAAVVPGVYDSVTHNNQITGICVLTPRSDTLDGHTLIRNCIVKNSIQGIYAGDNAFTANNYKTLEIYGCYTKDCIDHGIYDNGFDTADIHDNVCIGCGGISMHNLDTSWAHDNLIIDGFHNAAVSTLKTAGGINIRAVYNIAVVAENVILGDMQQTGHGAIYIQDLYNSDFGTVEVRDNTVDIENGYLFVLGSAGDGSTEMLILAGNRFKNRGISLLSGEPVQVYGNVRARIHDNIFDVDSTRPIIIQFADLHDSIIENNIIDSQFAGTRNPMYHTSFVRVDLIGNTINGNFQVATADTECNFLHNRMNWLNTNGISDRNKNVVRDNRVTIADVSPYGTVTSNANGVATITNLGITKCSTVIVRPVAAPPANWFANVTIGNNGAVTINTTPSTQLYWEVL